MSALPIAVSMSPQFERRGDSLADARAFEAAGCDALWLEGEEEPWLAAAAIAVVTARTRVVVSVTPTDLAFLPRRAATLQRLLSNRLALCCPAAMLQSVRAAVPCAVFCRVEQLAAAPADAAGVVLPLTALPVEGAATTASPLWLSCEGPPDRTAWRQLLARCHTSGAAGAIVRATPRLLDMLRNPDVDEDRSDLALAYG